MVAAGDENRAPAFCGRLVVLDRDQLAAAGDWQQFSVRGEKPGVTSLTAQVSAPAGITITYPAGKTDTSPSQLSTLNVGTPPAS